MVMPNTSPSTKHEDVVLGLVGTVESFYLEPAVPRHLAGSPMFGFGLFWSLRAQTRQVMDKNAAPRRHCRRVSSGRRLCSPRWLSLRIFNPSADLYGFSFTLIDCHERRPLLGCVSLKSLNRNIFCRCLKH